MAEETRGPDKDWESELSGEVDSDEDECRDGERGRQPGMVTGAEPPSDLGPAWSGGRRVSGQWGGGAACPPCRAVAAPWEGPWRPHPGLCGDHMAETEGPEGVGADCKPTRLRTAAGPCPAPGSARGAPSYLLGPGRRCHAPPALGLGL